MKIVVQTDYQDIYRITDGVLLVVNKFVPIDYSDKTKNIVHVYRGIAKCKSYNKNCQNRLKVLKEDYEYKHCPIIVPKDTVTYMDVPVICTRDKTKWKYELKTTGNAFSGDYEKMLEMLDFVIQSMIKSRTNNNK